MAKGSQLSQLKSALSKAGITTPAPNGKKRKRSSSQEGDRDKKAAKLKEIRHKLNPFDVKVTKLKHDVGGRNLKGVSGRPAQSKQTGIENRKKTLLKEYKEKNHAGGIVDRRFGENDPTLSVEERMLERFTKERQRASRGAVFDLQDEDQLTHYGQSLSNLDDFDNTGFTLDDEEEETGQIDGEIVKKAHFGGFEDDDNSEENDEESTRKKSKAEVMAEVMAKSKEHKLRRQMEREQEENLRQQLDEDFDSLRSLLYAPEVSSSGPGNEEIDTSAEAGPSTSVEARLEAPDEEYDQHVRELAFDKRAKPKDRTKTAEEMAFEEKEALEKAERKRLKRMMGDDDLSSEDDGRGRGKRKRERGGDDLDDDFAEEDEWNGLGPGLSATADDAEESEEEGGETTDGAVIQSGDEDEDEDSDETQGGGGEDEEASNSDYEHAGDSDEVMAGEEAIPTAAKPRSKTKSATVDTEKELPFTFPCPTAHEEFLDIVEEIADKDIPTVIQRIRTLYHPSLGPDNKMRLQGLTRVLIDHILYVSSPPLSSISLVDPILPHLFSLTKSYPIPSAEYFVQKLSLMHKNLMRGLTHGALNVTSKTWPGLSELTFFRVIGAIWPTSDMNHAVISPTRLLMGAYLGLARVRSLADLASGLYLCTLFLEFEKLSKRFVPEAVNFVTNAVLHMAPHAYTDTKSVPGSFPCPDFDSELCKSLKINLKTARKLQVGKPNLIKIMNGEQDDEQAKVDLLDLALSILGRFAEMYRGLDGFVELYSPIQEIITSLSASQLPEGLKAHMESMRDTTARLLKFAGNERQPLQLQAHKPIPIPSYVPKFEATSSSYLRRQDPDREKNEAAKLRKQYKEERKGAIRELRKDARFLASVQQQEQKEKDYAYRDSMKKVFGSIEGERAEEKAMEREKTKAKRRAGRK